MPNNYFQFKQFRIEQRNAAMKVTTDACLFGAWMAAELQDFDTKRMLDIGAGTGLLSLMVAQKNGGNIVSIEVEPEAARQASTNAQKSPWADHIEVVQGDARQFITAHLFDVIFSNPPFYNNDLVSPDAGRSLAHHGTSMRIEDVSRIIKKNLHPDGRFFLLLPFHRWAEIEDLLATTELYPHDVVRMHHSVAHPPTRVMVRGGHHPAQHTASSIFIHEQQDPGYTAQFVALLKDFYLKL